MVKSLVGKFGLQPLAASQAASASQNASELSPEAQRLFDFKKEALELAKSSAGDRKPTMTDYFLAAEQVGEKYAEEIANRGMQWNSRVYSDLSGQKIDGFQINKSDLQPPKEARMLATIRATALAKSQGREPTNRDTLLAIQQIQLSGEKLPSLESMRDTLDLDGDHAISGFYADIDRHAKFEGTLFANVSFHPAGTLMRDGENGVALTEGARFENVTFDGMGRDDVLSLKRGQYEDITLTNIKGGTIEIADGTQVDGMDVRGMHAELHIGRASVSNLDASGARVVRLETKPGAQITHANFDGATIEMASELEGSVWKDVSFNQANLVDVSMRGANLSNVRITDTNLTGLDLSGAKVENLQIDGKLITSPSQLAQLGIEIDTTTITLASPELVRKQELASIRETMQGAIASIGTSSPTAPQAEPAQNLAAAPKTTSITGITGGETVTLSDALAYNPGKDMVARTQPEQTLTHGMPGSNKA